MLGLWLSGSALSAQSAATFVVPSYASSNVQLTTSSAQNPLYGSVSAPPVTATAIQLTLTDAVNRGLDHNLAIALALQTQRSDAGQISSAFSALMPYMTAQAQTGTQSISLAAMGFKTSVLNSLGSALNLPAGTVIPSIVKVDTTGAQLNLSQPVFNLQAIEYYRAAKAYARVSELDTLNTRGNVVLLVGAAYLQTLAAAAQLQNEQALLRSDETALNQARDSHATGVATNLDELRARVQYQRRQQAVVTAENTFAKDKMGLNRMIGLAADQPIELVDTAPYADLAMLPLDQAKQTAYEHRKDYISLHAQVRTAELLRKAAKYERAPTVSIGGYYGVLGQTHGLYHGVFNAQGSISIPVFHEAQFRGDREVADAQLSRLSAQIADLEVTIESQLRSSMLDVQATAQLVKVARSNVDLAAQELADSNDRFRAGVEDNLPVVQAEATLAGAQTQLVNSLYQYNQAKLNLARNTGIIESQYQAFLGR
ncbi:MAG TPA: TolC family protein [Acidobacteriaceae bacterium]